MKNAEFTKLKQDIIAKVNELQDTKGVEYANSEDRFANFRRAAAATGATTLTVWLIYFLKHVDSISSYVKDPTKPLSEPMQGRIIDAIGYLLLGAGIMAEEQAESDFDKRLIDHLPL